MKKHKSFRGALIKDHRITLKNTRYAVLNVKKKISIELMQTERELEKFM